MSDPEITRLLPRTLVVGNTRTSKWGIGCIHAIHLLNYLRYYGIIYIDGQIPRLLFPRTEEDWDWNTASTAAFTVIAYLAPSLVGWHADTKGGRYEMLFFGKGISLTGMTIRFVIIMVCYFDPNLGNVELGILQGFYVTTVIFNYVSVWFVLPVTMVFGAQQIDQSNDAAITSYYRWSHLMMYAGAIVEIGILFILTFTVQDERLIMIGTTSVGLVADSLAIVFLMLGKKAYRPRTDGSKSLKEAWGIFRSHIAPAKRRPSLDITVTADPEAYDLAVRSKVKRVERLLLRRLVLMIGIMAVDGVFMSLWFAEYFVLHLEGSKGRLMMHLSFFLSSFVFIFIMQAIARRCAANWYHRNVLAIKGYGMFVGAIAVAISGYVHQLLRHDGKVSMYWLASGYILMGVACDLFFPAMFEFSYRESPPALACLNTGVAMALGWGISTTLALSVQQCHKVTETGMYGLAAAMLIVQLIVYVPLSKWYTQVRRDIVRATAERDRATDHVDLEETMRHDGQGDWELTVSSEGLNSVLDIRGDPRETV